MLITAYILLPLIFIVLIIYFYSKRSAEKKKDELKQEWGQPKDSRFFDFDLIENYFLNTIADSSEKLQLISEKIATDLYLNDVFKLIDRTVSKIGQQFLYARLRTLDTDTKSLLAQDRLAEEMAENEKLRLNAQLTLLKINQGDSYYYQDLIYAKPVARPSFLPIVYLLTTLNILCLLAAIWRPGFLLVFMGIFLINTGFYYWNKQIVGLHTSSLKEFIKVYEVAAKLNNEPELQKAFPETTNQLKDLSPLRKKMAGIKLDSMAEGDLAVVGFMVLELIKISFNVEIIVFYQVIDLIHKNKAALKAAFEYVGKVDAAISIASFRSSAADYCKPQFTDANVMNLSAIRHPLIENCVPNDLVLSNKNMLLTGSNMSGKTTFIRAIGINMILAQTIYTCTAKSFNMPYSKVFSSITISDSLLEEKSYYFEEMTIIKNFIEQSASASPCLFILDEIFKGTNTIERVSAGKAILAYLAKSNNFVFVSTHDTELNELLEDQYDHYHFSETIDADELVFDHTIKKGPLKTRNAIRILEINDYPAEIIVDANQTVDLLTKPS